MGLPSSCFLQIIASAIARGKACRCRGGSAVGLVWLGLCLCGWVRFGPAGVETMTTAAEGLKRGTGVRQEEYRDR